MFLELWLGLVFASTVLVIPGPTLMLVLGQALARSSAQRPGYRLTGWGARS